LFGFATNPALSNRRDRVVVTASPQVNGAIGTTNMNREVGKARRAWAAVLLVVGFSIEAEQIYSGSISARHEAISFLVRWLGAIFIASGLGVFSWWFRQRK
jgi:hypothetical protein